MFSGKHTHTHTSFAVATKLYTGRQAASFLQSLVQKPEEMASPNVTFLAFFVALALSALHTDGKGSLVSGCFIH